MYKLTLFILGHVDDARQVLYVHAGLKRDLLAQLRHEPQVRLIIPGVARPEDVPDAARIDLREHPNLSVRLLPWNGQRKSWPLRWRAVRRVLEEEARDAEVWHTGVSRQLWDLTTTAYHVGARHASNLRILCVDSDPAEMRRRSGGRLKQPFNLAAAAVLRRRFHRRIRDVDAAIVIGAGVAAEYARDARRALVVDAVWVVDEELADAAQTREKFRRLIEQRGTVRMIVPARLEGWKGVDTAIDAAAMLDGRVDDVAFTLDVMGAGPEYENLLRRARERGVLDRVVRFEKPVTYGEAFFARLRQDHLVLVPTQGMEEARIVYDALASGCVLVHSDTPTLSTALEPIAQHTYRHARGEARGLADAITRAVRERGRWADHAVAGLEFMRGRTIDAMHRQRAAFVEELRRARPAQQA